MAEETTQDVVIQAQSVDEPSSTGGSGTTQNSVPAGTAPDRSTSDDANNSAAFIANDKASADSTAHDLPDALDDAPTNLLDKSTPQSTQSKAAVDTPSHDTSEPTALTRDAHNVSKDGLVGDGISVQGSDETGDPGSAGPDTATNSDTDIPGKSDSVEPKPERAIVFKKPPAFKSVSVTKSFLAKATTPAVAPAKGAATGDKVLSGILGSSSAALRPRLVAKIGRDGRPNSLGPSAPGAVGPDASTVWNRNRPVPPPPPKHYTDEELKQQYGIQLATRLDADNAGKGSKWADEDDDDLSWLPAAVERVAVVNPEVQQDADQMLPTEEVVVPLQISQPTDDTSRSIITAESRMSAMASSGKTILRPGARTTMPMKPGLILKNLPEKSSQQEKPALDNSVKSPWAKLPPVEKASPISFTPPADSRLSVSSYAREEYQSGDARLAPFPAHEIGPDDFSRSWRDVERGGSRELYNSQSGKYEPVKALRRPSRQEPNLRPSSLLQRPSHQNAAGQDQPAAEDAVQGEQPDSGEHANDSQAKDPVSRETKHASNASNKTPPHASDNSDLKSGTANSHLQSASIDAQSSTPESAVSQKESSGSDATSSGQKPEPPASAEDVRALQQQLMRERIDAARKRKQDEEAKEETAKRERIAAKLAALGSPPKPASKKVQEPELSSVKPQTSKSETATAASDVQKNEVKTAASTLPIRPKSQTPVSKNLPSHDTSVTAVPSPQTPETPLALSTHKPAQRLSETTSTLGLSSPSRKRLGQTLPRPVSDSTPQETGSEEFITLPGLGQPPPEDTPSHSWQNTALPSGGDLSLGWSNSPKFKTSSSNVWGLPTLNKPQAIGHGAFERTLPQVRLPTQLGSPKPNAEEELSRRPSLSPGLSFDNIANTAASTPLNQNMHPMMHRPQAYGPPDFQQTSHNLSFAQPGRRHDFRDRGYGVQPVQDEYKRAARSAWQNFGDVAAREDEEAREAAKREYAARLAGNLPKVVQTYHETFKQTIAGETLGQRQIVSVSKTIHDAQAGQNDMPPMQAPIGTPLAQQSHIPVNLPMTSAKATSRYFGHSHLDRPHVIHASVPSTVESPNWPASPQCPPPETVAHPVHDGSKHPVVHLPTPPPVVRLPLRPSRTTFTDDAPVQMPRRNFRAGIQPLVNSADWQQRFNGLFGRIDATVSASTSPATSSPVLAVAVPMVSSLPIESLTRIAFELPWDGFVRVSLPHIPVRGPRRAEAREGGQTPAPAVDMIVDSRVESKPMEDEIWADREFGSLPVVKLPKEHAKTRTNSALPPPPTRYSFASKFQQLELSRDFTSTSHVMSNTDTQLSSSVPGQVVVHLLGREPRTLLMTTNRQQLRRTEAPKIKRRNKPKPFNNSVSTVHDTTGASGIESGVENERRPTRKTNKAALPPPPPPRSNNLFAVLGNVSDAADSPVDESGPPRGPRRTRGGPRKSRGAITNA